MSKPANTARREDVCMHCNRKPILARRKDATGERALYWCESCERPSFGGDSFVAVPMRVLFTLPLVGEPRQRSLL